MASSRRRRRLRVAVVCVGALAVGAAVALPGSGAVASPGSPASASPTAPRASASAPTAATTSTKACNAPDQYERATHSGHSCTDLPKLPKQKWSVTLNGASSYPVIADNRVFVTTTDSGGEYGGWLYALNAKNGHTLWGPVPLSGTYYTFTLAYGDGRVYVNDFDGNVRAFDAANGRQEWATPTDYFSGEPVVAGGRVWLQSDAEVFGLDERTGMVLTESSYLDGDGASVAATGSAVYVSSGCDSQFRVDYLGTVDWVVNNGCDGGGGGVAYEHHHLVYGSDGDYVMQAKTGAIVSTFAGVPAFDASRAYFATDSDVYAQSTNGVPQWTTDIGSPIVAGPIVTSKAVYVGTGASTVEALALATGAEIGSLPLPAAFGSGVDYSGAPVDIAIGDGLLVAPTGDIVTAFG